MTSRARPPVRDERIRRCSTVPEGPMLSPKQRIARMEERQPCDTAGSRQDSWLRVSGGHFPTTVARDIVKESTRLRPIRIVPEFRDRTPVCDLLENIGAEWCAIQLETTHSPIRKSSDLSAGSSEHRAPDAGGCVPSLAGEFVALTAHHDHVGFDHTPVDHDSLRALNRVTRPMGADSPVREPTSAEWRTIHAILDSLRRAHPARRDSIRNGADDDGSGTASILEIAEAMSRGDRPRRSMLFVSLVGEEAGLLGSAWFTDHPTISLDSVVAEMDQDMVGPTYAAPGHPLQYYCRADHYNYARYGIPAAAVSRGEHLDYHEATDEAQYISYPDLARVSQMIHDASMTIANSDHRLVVDFPMPADPHAQCRQ